MACFLLAIYFLAMAFCNYRDDKWFMGPRAKKLEGETRKKFRRVVALTQILTAIWAFTLFAAEDVSLGLLTQILLYVVGGILAVALAIYVEFFYFKKIIKEESV